VLADVVWFDVGWNKATGHWNAFERDGLWIGQRRWRMPAWAVAIKQPTIALQLTRRNRGDFDS
jgi:hypothetical protein